MRPPELNRRRWLQAATLAFASGPTAFAQTRDRSVLDDLPRMLDELDLPQMHERQSQLGFEVRTKEFVVVAATSMQDAREGARQLHDAWHQIGGLADHWTSVHRQPTFGIGALQLLISNEPIREQDSPPVTLNVVGLKTQIAINVAPGQPPLGEQLPRIREAAAWAFLHTAEFDTQLPAWVCTGLANFAVNQGGDVTAKVNELLPLGEPLAGQQWKGRRIAPDKLEMPPDHREQASLQVRYLLEGNDAEFAPEFLATLRATVKQSDRYWAEERRDSIRIADQQLRRFQQGMDDFATAHAAGFEKWLNNPGTGQPIVQTDTKAPAQMASLQQQMATILKLARRFPAGQTTSTSGVRVAAFNPDKREAEPTASSTPPRTIDDLYRHLTDPKQSTWATLDTSGRLLFSSETARIRELLAIDQGTFQAGADGDRWTISTPLGYRTRLTGWLEENKDNPTRPVAAFAQIDTTTGKRI
jgi:hypothetical protein